MIKAVILDFDDTLCLTEEICFEIENETLQQMGRDKMSRQLHKSTWGKPLFAAMLERSPGIDIEEFRKEYDRILPSFIESDKFDKIPDENLQTLDILAKQGYSLVILTSREHNEMFHILEPTHALSSRIEAFYYKDNMRYHKPDPRAFDHIDKEHGWQPEECVYVGDSVSDAIAAKEAGLHFIASLESGLRSRKDFVDYQVDVFINTFQELPSAIQTLINKI